MNGLRSQLLDPTAIEASPSLRFVHGFLKRTRRTEIGWHYAIDLAWLHSKVQDWPRGTRILDAGGGRGPLQFLLAEMGFEVVNIDLHHVAPGPNEAGRYAIRRSEHGRHGDQEYVRHLVVQAGAREPTGRGWLRDNPLAGAARRWLYDRRHDAWRRSAGLPPGRPGRIELVQADLCAMSQVADASFDAMVSLSSLEHVPIERLPDALAELDRVLKPGARVAMTTSASATGSTWFHEPSKGWCFGEADLRGLFGAVHASPLPADVVLGRYRDSDYLRRNLASFYARSGDNGMPWGRWDPAYVPVGLWR
jgi:ubiquinone/menaquinone biosynthesis C-methylase UbiE